jgi:hypothetical protein
VLNIAKLTSTGLKNPRSRRNNIFNNVFRSDSKRNNVFSSLGLRPKKTDRMLVADGRSS